jgi:hypothetical protein
MKKQQSDSYEAIRKIRTPILVIYSIVTFGIYWYIWFWKLITDINKLYPEKYIHRVKWFSVLILLDIISIYMKFHNIQTQYIINCVDLFWIITQLILSIQILKNIENYVKYKFNIIIKHNIFGWIFFGSFYINYKINRLSQSIQKELSNQIEELRKN